MDLLEQGQTDDQMEEVKDRAHQKVLRGKSESHLSDIITGDYSHNLGLIVTGGRDNKVRIWDYERVKLEYEIVGLYDTPVITRFIKPFPLLLTADQSGNLNLWLTIPGESKAVCLIEWRNMFTLDKKCPITAVDSLWQPVQESLKIVIGDEMGYVRVQDCSAVVKEKGLKPIDNSESMKRNPFRIFKIESEPN